jgi:chorismate synthase
MARRKPTYPGSTQRKEADIVEFLSGIEDGKTLGTPIGFIIKNLDTDPYSYLQAERLFRPSHADYTYFKKYGTHFHGGGRASGRETAARVAGGAIAKLLLSRHGIKVSGDLAFIGSQVYDPVKFNEIILAAAQKGDTLGGTVICRINGVQPGLGEPVFDKLQADLAGAVMSIGSAKGFEYGLGFEAAGMNGSVYNDQMILKDGKTSFLTNHDGGIQGGISNGEEIYFRVAFKPVPSVKIAQKTVDMDGNPVEITITGRHDVCHVPRLVVVVESMAALVMADHLLRFNSARNV